MATLHERIVETLREAVVVTDGEGNVSFMNRAARELGVDVEWLLRECAQARDGIVEIRAVDKIGTQRRLAVECTREGSSRIFIVRDLTVSKARDGAIDPQAIHDLNNLLAAIVTTTSVLRMNVEPDGRASELAQEIASIVQRSARLVRQILSGSRSEQPQPLDVGGVVREMEPLLRRIVGDGVSLIVECDASTGYLRADRARFENVLVNLVANARDATPDGGTITVTTSSAPDCRGTSHATITVADTGTGIPADLRERIFEPFFTTKPADRGTGLGLPSAQRFASENGGSIAVHSEVDRGTAVVLRLPRAERR